MNYLKFESKMLWNNGNKEYSCYNWWNCFARSFLFRESVGKGKIIIYWIKYSISHGSYEESNFVVKGWPQNNTKMEKS